MKTEEVPNFPIKTGRFQGGDRKAGYRLPGDFPHRGGPFGGRRSRFFKQALLFLREIIGKILRVSQLPAIGRRGKNIKAHVLLCAPTEALVYRPFPAVGARETPAFPRGAGLPRRSLDTVLFYDFSGPLSILFTLIPPAGPKGDN